MNHLLDQRKELRLSKNQFLSLYTEKAVQCTPRTAFSL